ncbi:MAG: sulfatase, partial [Armatimonadetes bacterium]|nr:sulfatase [Armatimonadota bacterium]
AGLLTGQCAHSSGMLGLAHRGWSLNDYGQVLLHTLRAHGYTSHLAGTQHLTHFADQEAWKVIGFDERLQGEDYEAACAFLDRRPNQPFYLELGTMVTHRNFNLPLDDRDDPRYTLPPACFPDRPETREDFAHFKPEVADLDRRFGEVLHALDRNGLADNTLVICTTDHGIAFPFMKCNLTDHGIGVMLIMRGPGDFRGGKAVDGLVSQIDLFPTLCDYLGISHPAWLQGVSFLPLVSGETQQVRDAIFSEVTYHAAYEPQRCIRTDRYKCIRRYDDRSAPVLPNCDDSITKDFLLAHGWREQPPQREMLFDLVFDPQETNNLAKRPDLSAVLDNLRTRLDAWMHKTNDPLLDGEAPRPPGITLNDPDDSSPRDRTFTVGE